MIQPTKYKFGIPVSVHKKTARLENPENMRFTKPVTNWETK
jgi:hypothetical protein